MLDIQTLPQTASPFISQPMILVTPVEKTASSPAVRAVVFRARQTAHSPAPDAGSSLCLCKTMNVP